MSSRVDPQKKTTDYNSSGSSNTQRRSSSKKNKMKGRTLTPLKKYSGIPRSSSDPFDSDPPNSAIITPARVAAQRLLRRAATSSTLPPPLQNRALKKPVPEDVDSKMQRSTSLPLGKTAFSSDEADSSARLPSDSLSTLPTGTNATTSTPLTGPASQTPVHSPLTQDKRRPTSTKASSTKRDDNTVLAPDSTPPESAIITPARVAAERLARRKATSSTLPLKSGDSKDDGLNFNRSATLPLRKTPLSSDKADTTTPPPTGLDSDLSPNPYVRTDTTRSTPLKEPARQTPFHPRPMSSSSSERSFTEHKGEPLRSSPSGRFSDSSSSRYASATTLTSSSSLTSAASDQPEDPQADVDRFNDAVLKLLAEHTERAERLIRNSSSSATALTLPAPATSTTDEVESTVLKAPDLSYNRSMNVDGLNRLFAATRPLDKTVVAPSSTGRTQTGISYNQKQVILPHEQIAAFEFPLDCPIEELTLSWTGISDLQLGALARQLKDSLETLELFICEELTDAGIAALGCLTRLRKFSLSSCSRVTAAGLCSFLNAQPSSRLTSLTIVDVEYTAELHEAVVRLKEIEHLELSCCDAISDECFLGFGSHLPALQTVEISGISAEAVSTFQQKFPKITFTHMFEVESLSQKEQEPVLELTLPLPQTLSRTARYPISISGKPPYQFLIDFLALEHPDVKLETVLESPEMLEDAVNAFYTEQLKRRRLSCSIPITPMNWLTLDRMLQNYRPVDYIFMSHFTALKYEMPPSEVLSKPAIYEQAVAGFYEDQLRLRRVEYASSITPETWLDVEALLQANHEQVVLNVFVRILQGLGYFEEQLGEQIPQNLEELYRILLANIRMLESIRSLNFSERQLIDLSNRIFCTKFKFLQEMNLSKNQIHQIPDFFLAGSENLEALLLAHNQLRFVPDNFGDCFPKIRVLDFAHNQITDFPRFPFATFQMLTLLNLEYNRITTIPNNILARLRDLPKTVMIDLTGNPIPPQRFKEYQKQCPQLMVRISLPPRDSVSETK